MKEHDTEKNGILSRAEFKAVFYDVLDAKENP
jgi:hypothetical protein